MMKNGKKMVGLIVVLVWAMMMPATLFAGSAINTPTVKYIDNAAVAAGDAISINDIIITESSTDSWQDSKGGRFTITIPADLALVPSLRANQKGAAGAAGKHRMATVIANATSPGSLSTSVMGTSTSPHGIFLEFASAGGNNNGVLFIYNSAGGTEGGSHYGLLKVYGSGNSATRSYQYGSAAAYGSQKARVAGFGGFGTYSSSSLANGSAKVGQIYYNSTTKEIVLTLAAKGRDTAAFLEKIVLQGFKFNARNTTGTGSQSLTFADGSADGLTNFLGITGSSAAVVSLTNKALVIEGAATGAANVPPTIPAGPGKVDGQAMGRLKVTVIGDTTKADNKLTISLDNGAKFHTGAAGITQLGSGSGPGITIAGTGWARWSNLSTTKSLSVNAAGQLVVVLGSPMSNQQVIQIPRSTTSKVIDTSAVTADSDITATVTGDGTDWAAISGTAVVASAKLVGTTVSFKDSSGADEFTTLYAGRKGEATADKLKIAETAPASLTAGGTFTLAANLGAKFSTNASLAAVEENVSGYTGGQLVLPTLTLNAAAASKTGTVTTASTSALGIWYYNGFNFDLSAATPGPLQITVSGTAGAAGVVTLATVINATATTVSSSAGVIVPGSVFNVPDIVITEQKAGALEINKIGLKFPAGFSIDDTGVTVSATAGTTSTSSITWGDVGATETSYAYLSVGAKSTTTLGAYTITISGLKLTAASTVSAGNASLIIAGGTTTWAATTAAGAGFNSNTFAKPTKQTLVFGSVVSATIPTVSAPVVSGTVVTQTFLPAGNDIGKVGDVYVFTSGTSGQYYNGSVWSATEAPFTAGATLDSMSVTYDVDGLAKGSVVYIGYGVGLTGTNATMNSNATFVLAYTTTVAISTGTAAGQTDVTLSVANSIELYLNITNNDGVAYADIAQEWLVFGAIVGGVDAGVFFFDGTAVTAFDAALDLATVVYAFDHTADTFKVTDLNMGTLGMAAGDVFWYAYVYAPTAIDLTDSTSYSVENVIMITGQ